MHTISKQLVAFLKDKSGPTAVEDAVTLALIIVFCIAAVITLGQNASITFENVPKQVGSLAAVLAFHILRPRGGDVLTVLQAA
jgi:pilus assembly protein Flp/PilA